MPSPSRKYVDGGGGAAPPPSVARARARRIPGDAVGSVGRRTGATFPPRGQIPLDGEGMEDADAFFAAAGSPSSSGGSPGRAYVERAEKVTRERERREEERRRRRRELEEEGRRNAGRPPNVLNRGEEEEDHEDHEDHDGYGEDGGGKPRAKSAKSAEFGSSYQPTPKQPGWTDRLMHRAMGVPTEDSPQHTVISRVSTAAPSTRASVDTIATEPRHGLRAEQSTAQLEALARHEEASPPAAAAASMGGESEGGEEEEEAKEEAKEEEEEEEEEEPEFEGGPMDPPEEMSQDSGRGGEKRGVDPVERDHLLEPEEREREEGDVVGNDGVSARTSAGGAAGEIDDVPAERPAGGPGSGAAASSLHDDASAEPSARSGGSGVTEALENSLEEVVRNSEYDRDYDDDDEGGGGMQLATQRSEEGERFEEEEDVDFGGGNDGGFDDRDDDLDDDGGDDPPDDDNDAVSRQASRASQKSWKSNASHKSDESGVSQKSRAGSYKSDKSDSSRKSRASSYKSDRSGISQKSGAGSYRSDKSGISQNSGAGSYKSDRSGISQKSGASSYGGDKSEMSQKSRASSYKSDKSGMSQKSRASSYKSERSEKSQTSEQPPSSSEEEEEEEKPYYVPEEHTKGKKGRSKEARKQPPPSTPTSVLRTKKSKRKKQHPDDGRRVNWSTPNGKSSGVPAGNRGYEAVPVSDYKEEYPPGEEPRTPGGSTLRRSRRARFKPLQFWKNEKLIYEAQNEGGTLGEAMGDMPVVAGVMHALPTPYKEPRRKEPEKKKKKRRRGDGDSDSDDASRAKSPFEDRALRKRYPIRNGEAGSVWSETLESSTDIKIVSRLDNRSFSKLPLSSTRKKRESKVVGFASQAFHVPTDGDDLFPGYIAGNVVLPPRGIKDAEGVGLCSQVFNVGDCQPGSVEFAIADPSGQDGEFDPLTAQRFLLGKGDMFQIPPGNVYRIENHSRTEKVTLFWTIIKCTSRAEQEDSGGDDDDDED